MLRLRFKIMDRLTGDKNAQKALSLAFALKKAAGDSSMITNCTPNKARSLTGCSAKTFVKYLPLMLQMGIAKWVGKNKEHLVITKLRSRHTQRNVTLRIKVTDFRGTYNQIREYLFLYCQSKKQYIAYSLQTLHNPKSYDDLQAAKANVRRLIRKGKVGGMQSDFRENGFSLKRIAHYLDICQRTAQKVVNASVGKGLVERHHNIERYHAPSVNHQYVEWATYTTKNTIVVVKANSYTLPDGIFKELVDIREGKCKKCTEPMARVKAYNERLRKLEESDRLSSFFNLLLL